MKKNLSKMVCVSLVCAWAGFAGPWQTALTPAQAPSPEREVEVCGDAPEGPELAVVPPQALERAQDASQWGLAALQPNFATRPQPQAPTVSSLSSVLALLAPGVAMAAPTPIGNMPLYPVQPPLKVSWSLQGMADDQAEGGEGDDVVEYGG